MKTTRSVRPCLLLLCLLAGVLYRTIALAQLQETWTRTYDSGNANQDIAVAMTVDGAGNVYVAGAAGGDYGTVKFANDGSVAWAAIYSGQHQRGDSAQAIAVDAAGNVYVTGGASSSRFFVETDCNWGNCYHIKIYLTDAVTVKYDSAGHQQWAASLSANDDLNHVGRAVVADAAGNVYVTGDLGTVKYDARGHEVWVDHSLLGTALAMDTASNLYVTQGGSTMKVSSNGQHLWSTASGGSVLALDSTGEVYITGPWLTKKLDSNTGTELWGVDLIGSGLAPDGAGNIYLAGVILTTTNGLQHLGLVKLAGDGHVLWSAENPTPTFTASALAVSKQGHPVICGPSYLPTGGSVLLTIQYSPAGTPEWVARHSTVAPAGVGFDASGALYVAGTIYPTNTGDFADVKYSQPPVSGAPVIQGQPQNTLAFQGETRTFTTTATGHGSLRFQWLFNGAPIADATNTTLALTDMLPAVAGIYTVEVGDDIGLTTSAAATLIVAQPPQPQSVVSGADLVWVAAAFGPASIGYQWQHNQTDIPGATQFSLSLSNITPAQAGDYSVVFTALGLSITSSPARLTVSSLLRQSWVARYDASLGREDRPRAMQLDDMGNLYVAGDSAGAELDCVTVKYGPDGNRLWTARYDGPGGGNDYVWGLAIDRAGNAHVTGISYSTHSGFDAVTIKYDPNGRQLWLARYAPGTNLEDGALAVTLDEAGNVYVAVYSDSGINSFDFVTLKYDPNGHLLWEARYDGPGHGEDFPYAIAVDVAHHVYVSGQSKGDGTDFDYATVKYDADGHQLWVARYNGPGNGADIAFGLAVDGAGNAHVSGWSFGNGTDYDFATIKYDPDGRPLWTARYNGPGNGDDEMRALALDATGNVHVTGYAFNADGNSDYTTIKYAPDGQVLWLARYDGPGHGDDGARALALDGAGNVYVTGRDQNPTRVYPYGSFTGDHDYATVKYNAAGQRIWVARFDSPFQGDDFGRLIAVDKAGDVYVSGYSAWYGGTDVSYFDFVTLKYVQSAIAAPRLVAATLQPGGAMGLTLLGEAGHSYTLEASTDLFSWSVMTNFVSATGTNEFIVPIGPGSGRRFYRAATP